MCVGFFTLTTVACSHFQTLRHEAKQASFSPPSPRDDAGLASQYTMANQKNTRYRGLQK